MYTVREARANFRKLLDDARFHPVAITRKGKTYLVLCKESAYMKKTKVDVDKFTQNVSSLPHVEQEYLAEPVVIPDSQERW